jgi:hypothetical protein
MKKSKIPTLAGIAVLVLSIAAGVLFIGSKQFFRLSADPATTPKDVRITNVSDTTFTVSWTTDKEVIGLVKWGKSQSQLNLSQPDEMEGLSFTHTATIRDILPQTNYYFKITSGENDFDNNGVAWQVKTGSTLANPETTVIISGSVITATGTPAKNSLVYLTVGGGSPLSTTTSQNGSWVATISSSRTQDLSSYTPINEANTLIEISVTAGPDGVATAQIYPQSAKPTPSIILGQVQDFKNLPVSESGQTPGASVEVPETTRSSGFTVATESGSPAETVSLESVKEGEVISSETPEFFGNGPSGQAITITIHSDKEITQEVTVAPNGIWKWSPPTDLTAGAHSITISWTDTSGVLRTLTRSFVVQASEVPAFVSTPSASPKSTSTPTPTPKPTPTPTPKAVLTASPSATPEEAPVQPVSGNLVPTIALAIMGTGAIFLGLSVWKKSEI